ncbi:MAG: SsrA-binding protein SmpB [Planctomycetota bacterium]|jgi:SsrA-binding protein
MSVKARKKKDKQEQSPRAVNKKAYRDYELVERFEAGLALLGTEVKSLRNGQADLDGSYARIHNDECWLVGGKIAQYAQAGSNSNHDPDRKRKLLLRKAEIRRIRIKLDQRGFTLVPLRIYFNNRGLAKIELALARGKRKYDKRTKIDERTQKRDVDRDMKKYRKR